MARSGRSRRPRKLRSDADPPWPVRGVPCGWRDVWDGPDDHAELRARAEAVERRQTRLAETLGVAWRQELTGMADASSLVQRPAGHEPEHCTPCIPYRPN
jgi:hypothetical protein